MGAMGAGVIESGICGMVLFRISSAWPNRLWPCKVFGEDAE